MTEKETKFDGVPNAYQQKLGEVSTNQQQQEVEKQISDLLTQQGCKFCIYEKNKDRDGSTITREELAGFYVSYGTTQPICKKCWKREYEWLKFKEEAVSLENYLAAENKEKKTDEKLITLTGITTSQIRTREKLSDTPAYCFLKTDQQEQDIPVIFRIKDEIKSKFREFLDPNYIGTYEMEINNCPFCEGKLEVKHYKKWCWNENCLKKFRLFEKSGNWIKPKIKKGSYLQVEGNFTDSDKKRKSFTAYSYQLLGPALTSHQSAQVEYLNHDK
ncbi:MAG: hypothetical protein MRERV_80c001 [Mycoplasmataceae bacterium RV_VA103A]|nr:MAG: hypothetical protein MRERV_80c001 [Mycoplasmataceae bacterium RV_VA103A]